MLPDFQTFLLPFLQFAEDRQDFTLADARRALRGKMEIDDDAMLELVPSGKKSRFDDRTQWACTYLFQAGLLNRLRRGLYCVSDQGKKVLSNPPDKITSRYLADNFAAFRDFVTPRARYGRHPGEQGDVNASTHLGNDTVDEKTPEEAAAIAHSLMNGALADEILRRLKNVAPRFFEQLVVDVLVAMGYGGNIEDAGRAVGRSGDGGIDGIIKEDRLGLDIICLQAKRWSEDPVGRPIVAEFAGNVQAKNARKGVFITLSRFTADAHEYAMKLSVPKIVLIDGPKLAELMIDFDVGVSTNQIYRIKRVDEEYFNTD